MYKFNIAYYAKTDYDGVSVMIPQSEHVEASSLRIYIYRIPKGISSLGRHIISQ